MERDDRESNSLVSVSARESTCAVSIPTMNDFSGILVDPIPLLYLMGNDFAKHIHSREELAKLRKIFGPAVLNPAKVIKIDISNREYAVLDDTPLIVFDCIPLNQVPVSGGKYVAIAQEGGRRLYVFCRKGCSVL